MHAEQQSRALELCDMAYRVMREGPLNWQTGLIPIEVHDLRIEQIRLDTERRGHLPNALNIAWKKRNVLTVKFSRSSEPDVVLYEPGEWERELEFLLEPGHGRAQ